MAFLQVSDLQKKMDVTLFPETYRQYSSKIREKGYYYLKGKIQSRDGRLQMILLEAEEATNQRFWIQLFDHQEDRAVLDILKAYPGPYPVVIRYEEEKKTIQLKGVSVQKNEKLENDLASIAMKTIYR
jgi:DNA-directed DNA polymerase III alpha subunit